MHISNWTLEHRYVPHFKTGLSDSEIAKKYGIKRQTVDTYRKQWLKTTGRTQTPEQQTSILETPMTRPIDILMGAATVPLCFEKAGICAEFDTVQCDFLIDDTRMSHETFEQLCEWGNAFFAK